MSALVFFHKALQRAKQFGDQVFRTTIRNTVRMRDAARYRQPISLFDPTGGATGDYRALTDEVFARLPQLVGG